MSHPKPLRLYSAITLSMLCFSLSFVWFKVANVTYGPLTIVLFRLILSATILGVFTWVTRRFTVPNKQDFKALLLLAFFNPLLYFMAESYGLRMLSPTVAAVIIATIPLVAPFAGYFFYKERVTVRHGLGILISFIGVVLVIYELGMGVTASPIGVTLQFGAVFSAVAYSVVLHKISRKMNNISIIFFQGAIGAVYFLPFWLTMEAKSFFNTAFDASAMIAIVKLALFASTVAFILFTFSVRHLGITKSNMFVNAVPVFTALFAWMILGDALTVQKVVGIVIVITGLFSAQLNMGRTSDGPAPIPRT